MSSRFRCIRDAGRRSVNTRRTPCSEGYRPHDAPTEDRPTVTASSPPSSGSHSRKRSFFGWRLKEALAGSILRLAPQPLLDPGFRRACRQRGQAIGANVVAAFAGNCVSSCSMQFAPCRRRRQKVHSLIQDTTPGVVSNRCRFVLAPINKHRGKIVQAPLQRVEFINRGDAIIVAHVLTPPAR
jgi:hypothetical protein